MSKIVVLVVASLVLGLGCRRAESPSAEARMAQLQEQVESLNVAGNVAGSRALLAEAMDDAELIAYRGQCLAVLLGSYLQEGATDEAEALYLKHLADESLARPAYGQIGGYYYQQGEFDLLTAWLIKLMDSPVLLPELKQVSWRRYVSVCPQAEMLPSLVERVPYVLAFDASSRPQLIAVAAKGLLQAGELELLAQFLDKIVAAAGEDAALIAVVETARLDALIIDEQLDEAIVFVGRKDSALPDVALSQRVGKVTAALLAAERKADAEAFLVTLLDSAEAMPATARVASRQWVGLARADGDLELVLERIGVMVDRALPLPLVFMEFNKDFYGVMQQPDVATRALGTAMLERLASHADADKLDAARVEMMQLDCAFFHNDFNSASNLLKAGIAGQSEEWHAQLLNKVEAHLAMQEGRIDDAIACFRRHMAIVAQWEHPVRDPSQDLDMYKEAVLGFNEKRIGDILTKAGGREAEAAAVYQKARDYYAQALALLDPDSREYEAAKAEMALVPLAQP
jgi:tetratricopeptide (TPR) repeat protein